MTLLDIERGLSIEKQQSKVSESTGIMSKKQGRKRGGGENKTPIFLKVVLIARRRTSVGERLGFGTKLIFGKEGKEYRLPHLVLQPHPGEHFKEEERRKLG